MKKVKVIFCLFFIISCALSGQNQAKNILGVSAGIVPAVMDMYFDMPFNFWPDRELSPVYHVFYSRQVAESFRVSSFLEYEKVHFSDNVKTGNFSFNRYNIGLNWLGQFPKTIGTRCRVLGIA